MTSYARIITCYQILMNNHEGVDVATLRSALCVTDNRSVRRMVRGLRNAGIPILVERDNGVLVYVIPRSYRLSH